MSLSAIEWSNEWRCESCGNLVDIDEVILEEHYGFEGEAWGYFFPAEKVTQVLSPCCRAWLKNDIGGFLDAESLGRDYW